jgi:hypothetical protein
MTSGGRRQNANWAYHHWPSRSLSGRRRAPTVNIASMSRRRDSYTQPQRRGSDTYEALDLAVAMQTIDAYSNPCVCLSPCQGPMVHSRADSEHVVKGLPRLQISHFHACLPSRTVRFAARTSCIIYSTRLLPAATGLELVHEARAPLPIRNHPEPKSQSSPSFRCSRRIAIVAKRVRRL